MTVLNKAVLIDYSKLKSLIEQGTVDNDTVYFLSGKDIHDKIKDIDTKIESKADQTSIPDISGFATKQEVTNAVSGIQVPSIEGLAKTSEVETKLADYAKKIELPDVSNLAVKSEVETTYAKKTELPDISNLAIKTEVVTKNDLQLIIEELKKINGEA